MRDGKGGGARREEITDAAIGTLAAHGMRGFTHRAVDRAAGLPQGSTSYYFRTRDALLHGVLDRMLELELAQLGDSVVPERIGDIAEFADMVTTTVRRWLDDERERTLARYELALEATRRPALHRALVRARADFQQLAERLLADAGVPEAAERGRTLVAQIDGLVFEHVTGLPAGDISRTELHEAITNIFRHAMRP